MSALPNFDNWESSQESQQEFPVDPDFERKKETYWPVRRFLDSPPIGIYQRETERGAFLLTTVFQIPEITEMQALAILDPGGEIEGLTLEPENIRVAIVIRSNWKRKFYNPPTDDGSGINPNIAFTYPDNSVRLFESGGILTRRETIMKLLYNRKASQVPDSFTIFMNTFNFTSLIAKAIRDKNIAPCPPEVLEKLLTTI